MEITSKEMIKPSSPTPHHLRNLKLSFLDQIVPLIHTPMLFFYQLPSSNTRDRLQIHQSLKQSLSNVLARFYPLAGRLCIENHTIDCNDSGSYLVEANVHANLMELVEDPTMDELRQLLPLSDTGRHCSMADVDTLILAIQINFFNCGGIAVAVQISHKIADGTSMVNFIKAWAAACRGDDLDHDGEKLSNSPEFNLVDFFPAQDLSIFKSSIKMAGMENIVTKRFVFDREKTEKLKLAESSAQLKDRPTRVEAVSAFFWRRFTEMARAKGSKKSIAAIHAVNLRPRMDPPLPNHIFGNLWRDSIAVPDDHGDLVCVLRNAFKKIDGDYVKKIQSGEYLNSVNSTVEQISSGEVETCIISSWLRFPVYEVDYGWGRPTWVSTTTLPFSNLVILMGTRSGDGMEAWVTLREEDADENFGIVP